MGEFMMIKHESQCRSRYNLKTEKMALFLMASTLMTLVFSGCGKAFSEEDIETFEVLVTFAGKVTNTKTIDASKKIRMALIWRAKGAQDKFIVGEDLELPPTKVDFRDYEINLRKKPPQEALLNLKEAFPTAASTGTRENRTVAIKQ